MVIVCRICKIKIESPRPDEEAQRDVLQLMSQHLGTHPKQAAELAETVVTVTRLFATYLLVRECVDIPANETALLASIEANEKCLLDLFQPEGQEIAN